MKTAVRTPTNPVTANATVGRGDVRPKFCKMEKEFQIACLQEHANKKDEIAEKETLQKISK